MALPGLVAAKNLADVADRERAWDNLGQSIEYPVQTGGFEYETIVYLGKVEAADGQLLEQSVKIAINNFVAGCKNDGTWVAIKACCILAGARTLSGALVPLAGLAPTNNGPFVASDYNRKTGLMGNGSTKTLNSNYIIPTANRNNTHASTWITTLPNNNTFAGIFGVGDGSVGDTSLRMGGNFSTFFHNINNGGAQSSIAGTNFVGLSRNQSTQYSLRSNNATQNSGASSINPRQTVFSIYTRTGAGTAGNGRLAFYSIGESLDLALLDARVTTLINAFAAAIP
jgi:hypothetical protein